MLEVRIDKIELGADWGYCGFRPLAGTLPEDFPDRFLSHIPVDRDAPHLPRCPGAPNCPWRRSSASWASRRRRDYGTISTMEPREHGGNLDNKELGAGATLYLPVWAEGANFSAGDGHGVQGDGEVCINALEICLTGTFTPLLHKGGGARAPAADLPARRDADPFHHHGHARGSRPRHEAGAAAR